MRLAVLGMGKLGGTELNYVSDIDVLFCHEPVAGAEPEARPGRPSGWPGASCAGCRR